LYTAGRAVQNQFRRRPRPGRSGGHWRHHHLWKWAAGPDGAAGRRPRRPVAPSFVATVEPTVEPTVGRSKTAVPALARGGSGGRRRRAARWARPIRRRRSDGDSGHKGRIVRQQFLTQPRRLA